MHLLLVEDNAGDALLVEAALEGCEATTELHVSSDGDEALAYLRDDSEEAERTRPQLVLLDLNLPGMSGTEVLDQMKTDPALRAIPVVIFTGSRAADDVTGAYDRHANSFITKPASFAGYGVVLRRIEEFWFSTAVLPEPPQ
ncbi:MAG: response regulator [Actinomycetota bacterium]|nr:response regulator [Actinomycetota bacterium]